MRTQARFCSSVHPHRPALPAVGRLCPQQSRPQPPDRDHEGRVAACILASDFKRAPPDLPGGITACWRPPGRRSSTTSSARSFCRRRANFANCHPQRKREVLRIEHSHAQKRALEQIAVYTFEEGEGGSRAHFLQRIFTRLFFPEVAELFSLQGIGCSHLSFNFLFWHGQPSFCHVIWSEPLPGESIFSKAQLGPQWSFTSHLSPLISHLSLVSVISAWTCWMLALVPLFPFGHVMSLFDARLIFIW